MLIKPSNSKVIGYLGIVSTVVILVIMLSWVAFVLVPFWLFGISNIHMSEYMQKVEEPAYDYDNLVGPYLSILPFIGLWMCASVVPAVVLLGLTAMEYYRNRKKWVKVVLICGFIFFGNTWLYGLTGVLFPRDWAWVIR